MTVQPDRIGDTSIPDNVQLYLVDISGQLVPALGDTSGHIAVEIDVADVVAVVSGPVQVQGTDTSGANRTLALLSGTRELYIRVSGQTIDLASGVEIMSGIGVLVSGQTVDLASGVEIMSGVGVLVSGQTVDLASGVEIMSGVGVLISGQKVDLASGVYVYSGQGVLISGQTVDLASGIEIQSGIGVLISGQTVDLASGVEIMSGVGVLISGQTVAIQSGTVVKTSGEVLKIQAPSALLAGYTVIGAQSGGTELSSGVVVHANVKSVSTSGDMWMGPVGVESGNAFLLQPGEEKAVDVDNLNVIYVISEVSGVDVSWLGEVA